MKKRHFSMVDMAITRCCNMKCKFCTATKTHDFSKMMPFDEFKLYLNKIEMLINEKKIDMPSKYISYGNVGEPLMHPNFIEINEYAKGHGWKTGIYTNGVLLTEEKMRQIYSSGGIDTINISITGIKTKIYKNFQGYGFVPEQQKRILKLVLNNIENAVKIREKQKKNTKIAVNYIITKKTFFHTVPYIRYMAKLGVDEIRFTPLIDRPRKLKKIKVKCDRLDQCLNIDEGGDISACNNDFLKKNVNGSITTDYWIDSYQSLVCNMNSNNLTDLPAACQICDRLNFSSFFDYMSMNFHGYLKIKNHKILWLESLNEYLTTLKNKIIWYLTYKY